MKDFNTKESGIGLVEVMILAMIILAAAYAAVSAVSNRLALVKAIETKRSYSDLDESLLFDVLTKIRPLIVDATPSVDTSLITQTTAPIYNFTNQVTVDSEAPESHQLARTRCNTNSPTLPSATTSRIYFCIALGHDSNAPKGSIFSAQVAFAEVAIDMVDMQTSQLITRSQYATRYASAQDGSAGLSGVMIVYWQTVASGKSNFSQHATARAINAFQ